MIESDLSIYTIIIIWNDSSWKIVVIVKHLGHLESLEGDSSIVYKLNTWGKAPQSVFLPAA